MAERRMFSKTVTESDAFLDMPTSARCLYFHLGMAADDDGFIASPKAIIRSSNCSNDDLKLLIAKGFIIAFENGIIVITHWKLHNYIQKDRYKPTTFKEEREQLVIENNVYHQACIQVAYNTDTDCTQTGYGLYTQVRIGEDKLSKLRVRNTSCAESDKLTSTPPVIELTLNDKSLYPVLQKDIDEWQELYQSVDVIQQLRNMKGWLNCNPAKRKTKSGIRRFINAWLSKEQNKGGDKVYEPSSSMVSAKLY